ncbi:MAG: hypothetical protein FJZ90_14945 [Chloroflexi bacterium]|nr:hypothetical protein [Chloroflexota bacterium]
MLIGKIVSANSHVEYICQVYGPYEAETPPAAADYAFGALVAVELSEGGSLVGVVADTLLVNPEFGNLGPRLSPETELSVFSPDYLAEKATLVRIIALGFVDGEGAVQQGVPAVAAAIDAPVRAMTGEEVVAFHRVEGRLQLAYLPLLMGRVSPLTAPLVARLLQTLADRFPEEAARLRVLADNLAWRSQLEPMA